MILLAITGSALTSSARAEITVGSSCPDILVVAARGSGELPQNDWANMSAYQDSSTYYGVGQVNFDLYQRLRAEAPSRQVSLDSVLYPAAPVSELLSDPAAYLASVDSGAQSVIGDLSDIESRCGGRTKYALSGYSQGAWVIHDAVWKLAKVNQTILSHIVAVTLFGDPLFKGGQSIVRDDKSILTASGIAAYVDRHNVNVPASLQSVTASYCFPADPVCQASAANGLHLSACANGDVAGCAHFRYVLDGKTRRAARFVIPCVDVCSWGQNNGTLGDGTNEDSSVPVQLFTLNDVISVAASHGGTRLALQHDGTVWAWGGLLGNGSESSSSTPIQVPGLINVKSIATGQNHSLALRNDGTVWAWGINEFGQLGSGTTNDSLAPTKVTGLAGVTAISAGTISSYALRNDGTVWAWGSNFVGDLGNGTTHDSPIPVQVIGLKDITAISAGSHHVLALRKNGTVWSWGHNPFGNLGTGAPLGIVPLPGLVKDLANVTSISGGSYFSLAIRKNGTVWAWGDNTSGQLGNGTTILSTTPTKVPGLGGFTTVSAGHAIGLAIRDDGTVWAWGYNGQGQLGNGFPEIIVAHPVQVSGLVHATSISAGVVSSLAVTAR